MNTYLSSSFNTDVFPNTKTSFTNTLKIRLLENPSLELRSILVDSRLAIHSFYEKPIIVICTNDHINFNTSNSLYSIENIEQFELSFRNTPTFTLKKFKAGKLELKESILIKQKRFAEVSDFTNSINKKLKHKDIHLILGFSVEENKFFFELNQKRSKSDIVELSLSAPFSRDLGFTNNERGVKIVLGENDKFKISADFTPRKRNVYYYLLKLNNCELASIQDVDFFLRDICMAIGGVSVDIIEISGVRFFKWQLKNKNLEMFFSSMFLNSFVKMNRYVHTLRTFENIGIFQEYEGVNSHDTMPIKTLFTPKLIKIFCNQLSHSAAMTSSSIGLLSLIPYKEDEFLKHEIDSPTNQALYNSNIDKLSFMLTDENKQPLNLSSGAPTFVHCTLRSLTNSMYKICHFDSEDIQSKKYYPQNSLSSFTQNLLEPLDSRTGDYYASLESIYIPSNFFNIFSAYTEL